ncbi:TIGR04104 family putative zinc finger protein [Bacillus sp. FSL K6-3431]|uniref:TIGR04104 family putative zinc finger protein n=1 Tax=Bacillus sp. FSL K6-3431 TaxID=2921500 RepID=UPI004046A050
MQKCDKCKTKFKWKQLLISLYLAYKPIQCRQCGTWHKIAFSSRIVVSLLTVLPLWILGLFLLNKISLSMLTTGLALIIFSSLLSLFLPILMRYSSKY